MTSIAIKGRRAAHGEWTERMARAGLAAQGVSFALVAVLALELALGHGGKATSRQGAFQTLAHDTTGRAVLVGLALGFACYALWRLANAVYDRAGRGDDAPGLAKRASDLGKAALYAGLTWSVLQALFTEHSSGGSQQKDTGGVLGWPGGRWLVLCAALCVFAAAGWNLYRGIERKFEKQLERCPGWLTPLAVAGLCARALVFALIGWFLAKAALEYDPKQAVGLGGALARLAQQPYGGVLLGVTAAGLLAFGAFCLAQARYRDV